MKAPDFSGTPLRELVSLEGKVAAITGGARGIGFAIAKRYAEAGADVIIGDLNKEAAEAAAEELAQYGHRCDGAELDASSEFSIGEFADRAVLELGRIDIWVNNAGIYPSVPFLEMSEAQWDKVNDLNLKGTFLGSLAAAKRMVAMERPGVIVNLASTAGFRAAGPGIAHYVASKHGVVGLTKSLAVELAPYGIRVLALAPTLIETPGIEEGREAFKAAGLGDLIDTMGAALPLARAGVPDDVARVALFCASDLSAFMTGSTLPVDAGDLAK